MDAIQDSKTKKSLQSILTARKFSGKSSSAARSQESSSDANLRIIWIKFSGRPWNAAMYRLFRWPRLHNDFANLLE